MLPAALLALAGLTAASPNVILHFSPRICMPGLEWAYYALTNGTGQGQVPDNTMPGSYQDQFSTDAVKGVEPTTTGTSLRITYGSESEECDASPAVVDGVSQGNASHATYSVVQHRGYLVAEQTGNYTLSVSASDLVAAWFGQDAVSGWDWSNVAVMAQSDGDDEDGGSDGLQTYSFEATEGDYLPMRIMYVNAQGCSALSVNFTRPDGMEILGADDIRSQNVIRDCIGGDPRYPNKALPFVPWSQES